VGELVGLAVGVQVGLAVGVKVGFAVAGCVVPELLIRIFATQLLPSFGFMMLSNVMTTSNPVTLP
jgi:hypothetical protein